LIKGGTVVDGTGAAAAKADVRVDNGTIIEIGQNLQALDRERVIDADGCLVTPGFIETHNHYDAPMWWMPTLEPMSGYGVTTSVNGHCGFTAAPCSDDEEARMEMVKIFSFFEDIPLKPFKEVLPWDWRKWSEYKKSLETNLRFPVNFATFCGHIAIRLAVMGVDAKKRTATPDEIQKMCSLLEDALDNGALGLSSNLNDYDGEGQPVPSILADDAEFEALLDVLARYPNKTFQIIISVFGKFNGQADLERVERLAKPRNLRVQWGGVPTLDYQMGRLPKMWDTHERFKAEGLEFYTGFHHVPPTTAMSFYSSLLFGQLNNLVWHELIVAPTEEAKLALLGDKAWRDRARESWDGQYPQSIFRDASRVNLHESQSGYGPIGCTLADYIASRGGNIHPSDALADWLIDNGFDSTLLMHMANSSEDLMVRLFRDPKAIGNISDSGAHGQMLCGIGDHIHLLTDYVRDNGRLTLEEAIHNLTGKIANHYGLYDRGELKVGRAADIAVFKLDEIERRPTERMFDVPDGKGGRTWRYTRAPAPMRLTLVNGVPTFDRGKFTGAFPGKVISPTEIPARAAQAAE
jgi:N-acyl-D-aspartate/D-glutamate deacylase